MPMRPPRSDSVRASTRNWARMSRPRAPMALRMPISRVRSRTDTSMMFMIPMPPTTSEIEAIPPSRSVRVALIEEAASSSWVWSKTLKSSSSRRRPARGDRAAARSARRWSRSIWSAWRDADADRPDGVAADEVLLHDADRHHDLVVGILEPGAALGLQDADDPERDAADRDHRPDVGRAEPEVVGRGRPEDRDAQVAIDADVGQERALPDVVGADRRVGRGRADDRRGRALVAGCDEQARREPPGPRRRPTASARDRVGVVEGQGPAVRSAAGRADRQQVRAEARAGGR